MRIFFLIVIIFIFISIVQCSLIDLENDLIYQRIKTSRDLEIFFRKLTDVQPTRSIRNNNRSCFTSIDELFNAFDIQPNGVNGSLSPDDIRRISPALFNMKLNDDCRKSSERTSWKNILIGFVVVSFINCAALGGAIILPFRKTSTFKWILLAFIGLAVGTLTSSGIFHLIPMAFNIPNVDLYHNYLTKALLTMIVIYFFFIRDQLSKIFLNIKPVTHTHGDEKFPRSSIVIDRTSNLKKENLTNLIGNLKVMKAVGWMIFLGDVLHNFIDGLTLGAAFTVSISEGLRMALPIACEEFPHELGDIAVLLSSGLTIGQALMLNFLAACSCYLGYFLGVRLGELEEFHPWIYALTGGMFVYIGLADMVPELISIGDEIERDYIESKQSINILVRLKIFLCQNSGIIFGVIVMYLLARYGEKLQMKIS